MADTAGRIPLSGKVGLRIYDAGKRFRIAIGATVAIGMGVFATNKIVNVADNGTELAGWIMEAGVSGTDTDALICFDPGMIIEMKYIGTATAKIGTTCGVSDHETVDFDDTSNDLVRVLDYDTTLGTCLVQVILSKFGPTS